MQRIRRKLQSNSGASMLMALLLMLVGVVTSAVIIAAAINAALFVKEEKNQMQAYLTVSSAAQLISGELERGECDYSKSVIKTYRYSWSSTPMKTETKEESGSGAFSAIIKEALAELEQYPTKTFNEVYTISVEGYDEVSAEVFIKKSAENTDEYNLTVYFEGGEEPNRCRMILKATGKMTSSDSKGTDSWRRTTVTTTTTVAWKDASLARRED